jgi:hypothetical protein
MRVGSPAVRDGTRQRGDRRPARPFDLRLQRATPSVDSDSALIGTGTGRTAGFALHRDEADVENEDGLSIR